MRSSCCSSATAQTLKVLCVRMCMLYSTMCLMGWPLSLEAARLRCGSDLLSDLIFVCGDRGIYLGKAKWSGYGARPRGKGIVDQCCRPAGCDLHHLELYCAKPKTLTTAYPTTTTATHTTSWLDMEQQFQAVYQKRLLEHLGAPNSPKRDTYRKKTQTSLPQKRKTPSARRRITMQNTTSRPPPASGSPPQRMTRVDS
uniref:Insulin-like growth factor 3 n=2 Tax=Mastacembelus armatus TaxID=205130 RepID=A0A3Q3M5I6_9TELE